jgi:uncharacterized membrane-anchored protein
MNIVKNKLPQITLAFWVMKICATTLGETAGDLLSMTLNVGYTASSLVLLSAFAVLLVAQLSSKKYHQTMTSVHKRVAIWPLGRACPAQC